VAWGRVGWAAEAIMLVERRAGNANIESKCVRRRDMRY